MEYLIHILILIGIYIILATSLNMIVGLTGLLSIGHAVFFGVGAYFTAIMSIRLSTPFFLNLLMAILISSILGGLLGWLGERLRDNLFVIATFSLQIVAFSLAYNCQSLFGGPMGLAGIPQPIIFGLKITSHLEFLILIVLLCLITIWVCWVLGRSPYARVLRAIREDEQLAESSGKNVAAYKRSIFALGAGLAAIAGVVFAHYMSFIDPTSFTLLESIFILSIVIIGGAGSMWGPVLGAVVLVVLPELLRFIGLPNAVAGNLRQMIYGVALVVCMLFRPQGLIGEYGFGKKEKQK